MSKIDDVTIDWSRQGETFFTPNIRSGKGRIYLEARLNNYALEKTSVVRKGHRIFFHSASQHLRDHPADVIELTGFATNDKAGQAYNEKVAMNRAEEAAEFLMREAVPGHRILINPAQVVGKYREQLASDRRVDAKILEQLSDNYRCRMVTWKDLDAAVNPILANHPALVITGVDIEVEGFFYMMANLGSDLENRFTPVPPALGGSCNPSMPISINDFNQCGASCTMAAPTMVRIAFSTSVQGKAVRASTVVVSVDWLRPTEDMIPFTLTRRHIVASRRATQTRGDAMTMALPGQSARAKAASFA